METPKHLPIIGPRMFYVSRKCGTGIRFIGENYGDTARAIGLYVPFFSHFFLKVALLTIFRSGYMAHIIIQYDNTPCAHNNLIAGQIIFRCQYYVALDVAGVLSCAAYCLVPLKIVSNFIPTKGPNVQVGEG